MLDRVTPALRSSCTTRRATLQTWKDLLFIHYEVPESAVRALLPPGVSVDLFEGRAFVGVVPFTMHAVRVGVAAPALGAVWPVHDFEETNVRTYVHAGGVPGVWFFSLDATSRLAVLGGRTLYSLPYFHASMRSVREGNTYRYQSSRGDGGAALDVEWTVLDDQPHRAEAGSLEHFLTERYALYGPKGSSGYRVRVHHAPWPLHRAAIGRLETTLPRACGVEVREPIDLLLASPTGVAVETFGAEAI